MLELIDICKKFSNQSDNHMALNRVSAQIKENKITVIIGPSGSGKSTLLRSIAKLETPDSGKILFDNQPYDRVDQNQVSMVFQGFHLFPHLTVLDNITLAPRLKKLFNKNFINTKAMDLLEKFGLLDKKDVRPNNLSGGQKQRVAICRALMMDPKILLFDEPTSALDIEMTADMAGLIRDLKKENRIVIMTTHELNFAKATGDEVIFMDNGQILEHQESNNFFKTPKSNRAQEFIKNVIY